MYQRARGFSPVPTDIPIYFAAQTKFSASFVEPTPFHFATCGYGHNGQVMSIWPPLTTVITLNSVEATERSSPQTMRNSIELDGGVTRTHVSSEEGCFGGFF